MPYKEYTIKKKYFTIGEVAEEINCATSALRYLEDELKIEVGRDRKGNRKYTQQQKQHLANAHMATRYLHINAVKVSQIWKDTEKLQQILSLMFLGATSLQLEQAKTIQNTI